MRPLVSVVIPTWNRADLLREAIDSVFAQQGVGELFDLEALVVDDASSDHTPDVVARYGAVRHIRLKENRGLPAGARNVGIEASTGTYVAFLDDDDLWLPGKLKLQVPALESNTAAGVAYSHYYIQKRGRKPVLVPEAKDPPSGWVLPAMLTRDWDFITINLLVRRDVFERVGTFDESLGHAEDRDLLYRLAFHVPFVFIPGAVAVYREARTGLNSTMTRARAERALRAMLEKVLALLPETEESSHIRETAWARFALGFVPQLASSGDMEKARVSILDWLRVMPTLGRDRLTRRAISAFSRALGRTADQPIEALERLCAEVVASVIEGEGSQAAVRHILADVWREGTIGAGMSPRRRLGIVGYGVVRALSLNPFRAVSRDLLKAVVKSVLPYHGTLSQR